MLGTARGFEILPPLEISDHSPILFTFQFESKQNTSDIRKILQDYKNGTDDKVENLGQEEAQVMRHRLSSEIIQQMMQYMTSQNGRDTFRSQQAHLQKYGVDEATAYLQKTLRDILIKFGKTMRPPKSETNFFPVNPWFDEDCKAKKRRVRNIHVGRELQIGQQQREAYIQAKKEYTNVIRKKKKSISTCSSGEIWTNAKT